MSLQSLVYRAAHSANTSPAISRAARRVVPGAAIERLARRLGADRPQQIDLSRLDLIRAADPAQLRDVAFLEHDLLPRLGLCADVPAALPDHLRPALGQGLRHWQSPRQFARYLAFLSTLPIASYLEIGVRHGGTFVITVEYLSRFHPVVDATAIDLHDVPAVRAYGAERPGVRFAALDSRSAAFADLVRSHGRFDLVLVDGDHSYEACRSDLETVREHANVIALHDVVDDASPGVRRVWQELRGEGDAEFAFHAFTEQYDEVLRRVGHPVLGLGVAVRRSFA